VAAPRRERDETRVFKRMGEGLARATEKVEHFATIQDMHENLADMDKSTANDTKIYQGGKPYRKGK